MKCSAWTVALVVGSLVAGTTARGDDKPGADQANAQQQTIRGTVAGVTVLGETVINEATGRGEAAQASYLTIVGWPTKDSPDDANRAADDKGKRDNVYILAVMPKTKVESKADESGNRTAQSSFENLELGDRVEVMFTPTGRTALKPGAASHHGRHRTYRGYADSITIMPQRRDNQSSSSDRTKP